VAPIRKGENRGVPHAVLCFKKVVTENVAVRHMTVVAIGILTVRIVRPSRILGCHDVAVDTSLWIIGQVGMSPGNVKCKEEQAKKDSQGQYYR
jgi:hypothetical protein